MLFRTTKWAIGLTLIAVFGKLLFNQFARESGAENAAAMAAQYGMGSLSRAASASPAKATNATKAPDDLLAQLRAKKGAAGFTPSSSSESDQWKALLNSVVASPDWAVSVARLKQHPDANRWMVSEAFNMMCHMATRSHKTDAATGLDATIFMPKPMVAPWRETGQIARQRCGEGGLPSDATNWRKLQ